MTVTEKELIEELTSIGYEKLRAKTPQQVVEVLQQIVKIQEIRRKQGELLVELRNTILLEWFGEEEKRKYLNTKRDGKVSLPQLKRLWKKLQEMASRFPPE
jgi:hypothetical protein